MKKILSNNSKKVFSGVLLGAIVTLTMVIFLLSNSVLSTNIVPTDNVSVTDDVYVVDVYDMLEEINLTTYRAVWNISYLYQRETCNGSNRAEVGTKCWYIDIINTTLHDMNITLIDVNITVQDLNSTNTFTSKLIGNVLASFGKNLYVTSGDPTSVDENFTGHDGVYEVSTAGVERVLYFDLEQVPLDNLTVEIVTHSHLSSATTYLNLSINHNIIFENWNFDRGEETSKFFTLNKTALQRGENEFNLTACTSDVAIDYIMIYTQSGVMRLLRASQYNTTSIFNLTNYIYTKVDYMNATVQSIYNDTNWLRHNLNCSDTAYSDNRSICAKLGYLANNTQNWTEFLRQNITYLQGNMTALHTRLMGVNTTVIDVQRVVGEIRNMTNCSAGGVQSDLCDKLNNITIAANEINITVHRIRNLTYEINQTTHHLWERWKRRNDDVILNETLVGITLSSTLNVTINYNFTIPGKFGFDTTDYLPVRWKFWFIDSSGVCINQNREFRNVYPYCNPLVAQYVGLLNGTYLVNVSLRPSLNVGNYTIVREIEIDPPVNGEPVWILHGRGPIGMIQVTESTWEETEGDGQHGVMAEDTNYIDDGDKWEEKYNSNLPTPTVLTIEGEKNILHASIQVEVSNTFIPDKQISVSQVYEDVVQDGKYNIPLLVNLVQGEEYLVELTICEGPTFDPEKYDCETSVEKFIA